MAYTTIDNPELYFQSVLWTGNGSNPRTITFGGDENMQPDLLWYKCRSHAVPHILLDSVRTAGNDKELEPNATTVEGGTSAETDGYISAFTSDGFTVTTDTSSDHYVNEGSRTFVAWCWKAGTSFSNDASATSVGSIDSSGSASSDAGFSICSYTGSGSAATIKHGLSTTPSIVLVKALNSAQRWTMHHKSLGATKIIYLNETLAEQDETYFNDTSPTSSVFSVDGSNVTGNTYNYIAYCFAEKQGFSKFGSFEGNGNADGAFVYTGFRPAFVLAKKSSSTGDWGIYNNKSNSYNVMDLRFKANTNAAEDESSDNNLDFLSNGFKHRTASGWNASATYIYMAFAEAPFVNSKGVPCNAR
jgi:hypothetical protein